MKTVAIAGATGLIGSALKRAFEDAGYPTYGLDPRTAYGYADIIVHAAGYGQPTKFLADEQETIRCNVSYTSALLNMLSPGGTFLLLSTSELYSGSPHIPHTEDDIGTTAPDHPRASYIESKRCGEALVYAARRKGIDAKIARCCLIYGPGTRADDSRILNVMMRDAITKREVRLRDNGMAMRPYLYIDDAVQMLMAIVRAGTQAVYNVGLQSTETLRDAATLIGQIEDVPVYFGESPPLPGSPLNVCVSTARYEREFGRMSVDSGYLPTSFDEGLRRTLAWQRENLYGERVAMEQPTEIEMEEPPEQTDWRRARGLR